MSLLYENESYKIRGAAFEVYKNLGCGHKEVVYQQAYFNALVKLGLKIEKEKQLPVFFQGKRVGVYVPDIVVENKIPIELKAKPQINTHDIDQFWHYLTGTEYKLGFLINFGKPGGVEIIRRIYETTRGSVPRFSEPSSAPFRVALAHDSFTQLGGAERVIEVLHEMFPDAPVYTLVLDKKFQAKYSTWDIRATWLQKFYYLIPKLQYLLPLIPFAVSSLDFTGYDVVISSSSSWIKNIKLPKNCIHINYCHTPTRFLWSEPEYVSNEVPFVLRPMVKVLLSWMKKWDYNGAQKVNYFIANSQEVQKRIKEFYHRDSQVICPFIDTEFWHQTRPKGNYFLIASRLQAHKKNDLVIEIFNELGFPLHIVGTGRQENYLKSIAKPNIRFLGWISDERLRDEYSAALGLIFPQKEDFGLVPLEAAACGTATLAYGKGGSLETVIPGKTGELFEVYDKEKIKQIILNWDCAKYQTDALRSQVEKFSKEKFKEQITVFIEQSLCV